MPCASTAYGCDDASILSWRNVDLVGEVADSLFVDGNHARATAYAMRASEDEPGTCTGHAHVGVAREGHNRGDLSPA